MAGYTMEDMERMQAEAERRVREMRQRAQQAVTGNPESRPAENRTLPAVAPRPAEPPKPAELVRPQRLRLRPSRKSLLGNDTLLLLAVLLLLSGNESDELLLLALLYIIL